MEGKEVGPLRQAAGIAKAADWKLGERWGSPELQEVLMTTTEKVTGWFHGVIYVSGTLLVYCLLFSDKNHQLLHS
jgi:hypothetical protein